MKICRDHREDNKSLFCQMMKVLTLCFVALKAADVVYCSMLTVALSRKGLFSINCGAVWTEQYRCYDYY